MDQVETGQQGDGCGQEGEDKVADLDHYPIPLWAGSVDEMRRAWLIEMFANSDIDAKILIQNLDVVCRWLETGEIPETIKPIRKI